MAPLAPRRPCLVPGCAGLQPCPKHAGPRLHKRRAWERVSKAYREAHPWCAECQRQGRITLATDVHHVVPHRGVPDAFWVTDDGLEGLCHACHSRITQAGG